VSEDEILTIRGVAGLLHVGEKTVYGLAQRGEVPAFKVGGQWRFSREAIGSWIRERSRPAWQPGDRGTSPGGVADDPRLAEIVRRLVETCRPERIYLFGSRARGEGSPHSDYDLMVIVASSDEPQHHRAQRAHAALWDLAVAADVLVWTREEFDSRLHLRASLPATIVREGTLLHAA
jgi:excisionase family DNA binding protein